MRMVAALLVVGVLVLGLAVVVAGGAEAKNQSQFLPAFEATYPGAVGSRIDSCYLCHVDLTSYRRNPYARDWDDAEEEGGAGSFRAIENRDSDGDGYTNLQEINAHTFPGDSSDSPDTVTTTAPGATTTSPPPGSGGELFNQNCASCHGSNGGNLVPTSLSRTQLIDVISNGRGGMPSYAGTLSSTRIGSIADFLLASSSVPTTTTTITPGATTTTTTPRNGSQVWSATCSGCHGTASNLQARNLDPTRVRTVITNGTTGMPAYGTTLSPAEIDNLVTYLATTTTTTGSGAVAASGEQVYERRCAGCHGSGGGNLAGRVLSLQEIGEAIKSGVSGMPALSLSPSELDAVTGYVDALTSGSATSALDSRDGGPHGVDLWVQFCSSCHGTHDVDFPGITVNEVRIAVRSGAGSMPGFSDVLDDAEVEALVSFVMDRQASLADNGVPSTSFPLETTSTIQPSTSTTAGEDSLVFAREKQDDTTRKAPLGLALVVALAMAGLLYIWFRAARHLFSPK